jgi:hypothetical protein
MVTYSYLQILFIYRIQIVVIFAIIGYDIKNMVIGFSFSCKSRYYSTFGMNLSNIVFKTHMLKCDTDDLFLI